MTTTRTPPSFRIALLLVAIAVLVALAGCSAPVSNGGTPTASPSAEPAVAPFPTAPEQLTEESVGPYVGDFEEAYRHNVILANNEGVTEITTFCDPTSVTPGEEDGFTVVVSCGFTWTFEQDGAIGIADGVMYEATYRVSAGWTTERVGSTL